MVIARLFIRALDSSQSPATRCSPSCLVFGSIRGLPPGSQSCDPIPLVNSRFYPSLLLSWISIGCSLAPIPNIPRAPIHPCSRAHLVLCSFSNHRLPKILPPPFSVPKNVIPDLFITTILRHVINFIMDHLFPIPHVTFLRLDFRVSDRAHVVNIQVRRDF
jgi:hypothetical protein